jgi:hypothetical protein
MSAEQAVLRLVPAPADPSRPEDLEMRSQALWAAARTLAQDVGPREAVAILRFQSELATFLGQLESEVFPALRQFHRILKRQRSLCLEVESQPLDQAVRTRFGKMLWDARLRAGLSRSKLARRMRADGAEGLSEATLKLIEYGRGSLTRRSLLCLLRVEELGLTTEDVEALVDPDEESA